jgi:RHS repeat-associated protein
MTQNNQTYYLHYDQVGTLRLITDINQNIIKEITYDTFGNILQDTNPNFQVPFGFAGGLYDQDTQLVHFGYREYDPYTGKWTTKDPIDFSGGDTNLYGYVLGDPVNLVDPEGLNGLVITRPIMLPRPIVNVPKPVPIDRIPIGDLGSGDGIDMTDPSTWPKPPVEGPCKEGDPSRSKPKNRGEKSLYDENGGEWRPHLPDKHHPNGHWDHKPGGNPKNQWQDRYPSLPYGYI